MRRDDETVRIAERYARRTKVYEPLASWVLHTSGERERAYALALRNHFGVDVSTLKLLEIGSGHGGNLMYFSRLGFAPENLSGIELLAERVEAAKHRLPLATTILHGDASRLPFEDESQDVVFQSLVFSSILDDELTRAVADEMWRVTKRGGMILWYDFVYSNPKNPDVRGVSRRAIRTLFPDAKIRFSRVTLAPPLSRILCRVSDSLYFFGNLFPFLRTHVIARISR